MVVGSADQPARIAPSPWARCRCRWPPRCRERKLKRDTASRKTMVTPAITMFNAISLGVSGAPRLPQRDHAVQERLAGVRRDLDLTQSESTWCALTALRSPPIRDHRRAFARDGGFVHAGNALDVRLHRRGWSRPPSQYHIAARQTPCGTLLRFRSAKRRALSPSWSWDVSAWALPRPSAMASAKLANSA